MNLVLQSCGLAMMLGVGAMGDTRSLIEQALNEPTKIQFDNVRLADALKIITEQTGVKVVMPPEAMRFAPGGPMTTIQRVQISHVPLRQALTQLFAPLGMEFEVRDDRVEIVPKETVLCLGRAPTWEELDLLGKLAAMKPGTDPADLERLHPLLQYQISVPGAWEQLAGAIRSTGGGPGDQVLTVACGKLGWAWCVDGAGIIVAGRERLLRRQLQQPVSMRLNSRPLCDVLSSLGRAVYVPIRSEPGALASLPPHVQRNFSLNVQNEPVETVLEKIAGYTGLGYLIDPEGVVFYRPGAMPPPPGAGGPSIAVERNGPEVAPPHAANVGGESSVGSDPYIAKVVVPMEDGRTVEWLIRRSELPEDLKNRRDEDIKKAFEEIRGKTPTGRQTQ